MLRVIVGNYGVSPHGARFLHATTRDSWTCTCCRLASIILALSAFRSMNSNLTRIGIALCLPRSGVFQRSLQVIPLECCLDVLIFDLVLSFRHSSAVRPCLKTLESGGNVDL